MKLKFYFSIVLMISLLMLSTGCGLFNSGPGGTVKNFYNAVKDGKIDVAISQLSSQAVATLGEPKLRASISQQSQVINNAGGIDSMEIQNEQVNGQTAQVTIQVAYGNGTTQTETVKLLQEDGKWKIDVLAK